jgi:hypothetical protein
MTKIYCDKCNIEASFKTPVHKVEIIIDDAHSKFDLCDICKGITINNQYGVSKDMERNKIICEFKKIIGITLEILSKCDKKIGSLEISKEYVDKIKSFDADKILDEVLKRYPIIKEEELQNLPTVNPFKYFRPGNYMIDSGIEIPPNKKNHSM